MNTALPLISAIVPVYNTEAYVGKCLDSLIQQTLAELEIIVIDDRGDDHSMEIVRQYALQDSRITIITNDQNSGVAHSRNQGIRHARGEYLAFIDSDDWIAPDYFEILYKQAILQQADIVKGNFIHTAGGHETPSEMNTHIRDRIRQHEFPGIAYLYGFWNAIYKKELITTHHLEFPRLRHGEDLVFLIQALHFSKNFSLTDSALYYYNMRENSASKSISPHFCQELFQHEEMMLDFIESQISFSKHDYIEFFEHAMLSPLLNYQLSLVAKSSEQKESNLILYFTNLKKLLQRHKYFYEHFFAYPKPIYQSIHTKTAEELTNDYLAGKLPLSGSIVRYQVRLLGILPFSVTRTHKAIKAHLFGIPILKLVISK